MNYQGWVQGMEKSLVSTLLYKYPELPQHIGIVMDGNRRYAREHHASRHEGHSSGFETMSGILAVAYSAGIREITVYAFSIENFNRNPDEVEDLMNIARDKLGELVAKGGVANKYGVKINVMGRVNLLPLDLQELANEITEITKNNTRAVLNLCMPYTARDDITHAIQETVKDLQGKIRNNPECNISKIHDLKQDLHENENKNDNETSTLQSKAANDDTSNKPNSSNSSILESINISEETITSNMYENTLPLDLLIRTSGTYRLSDFMLWEITMSTYIDFVADLWPEYSPFCFMKSITKWLLWKHDWLKNHPQNCHT